MKPFRKRWLAAAMLSLIVALSASQVCAASRAPKPFDYADPSDGGYQIGDPDAGSGTLVLGENLEPFLSALRLRLGVALFLASPWTARFEGFASLACARRPTPPLSRTTR